jgi:acyl-CoA thioester hydrolase
MSGTIDLTDRVLYRFWHKENLRFSDTDMNGHVNNVAFAALLESGRTAYTHGGHFPRFPAGCQVVMARVEIDYRMELHWPNAVDIGTSLLRVGNSSFVLGQGIFRGADCVTTGRTVLVLIDKATRRSAPLPADYRAALLREITDPPVPATPVP